MRVVVFTSEADGALARIEMLMPTAKGKMKLGWSPVVVHAPTGEEARARAETFYASELERFAKREASQTAGRLKAAATRAAKAEAQS